jgi:hypothetical protein
MRTRSASGAGGSRPATAIAQVGATGLNVEVPLNEEGTAAVRLTGQFISVEGEHAEPAPAPSWSVESAEPELADDGSSYHQRSEEG